MITPSSLSRSFPAVTSRKVVVGREFDYEPDLLIMNQPTRGIDVGAIEFIRKKIVDMRSRKKAILTCIRGLKRDPFLK